MLKFEPIILDRQKEYLSYLDICPVDASDYSFINIFGWAEEYGLTIAFQDDLVWIRQAKPKELYWAPVGNWGAIDWSRIFHDLKSEQIRFTRIPENLLHYWKSSSGSQIKIDEERGNWDYLYSVNELIELKGNRFHKKKNLVSQFKNKYEYTFAPLKEELITMVLKMQEQWCLWRDCESSDMLSSENRVISRILHAWNSLPNITGGAILIDQKIVAFTVGEILKGRLIVHLEKGLIEYTGIYQAINQMFLESTSGIAIVNRQEDLNDEGLRQAKLSYNPIDFVKKYCVTSI